jgi:MtrB/PioB family decaheme-associated outer membrane protein
MKSHTQNPRVRQSLVFLALAAAFGPACAADDIAQFTKPSSSITVGAGAVSGNKDDRAFFGQYNGLRNSRGSLQLDVDYLNRDDASGTWTALTGNNLGNENRELGFSQQKQGDWKYRFSYGELVRNYSNTLNTRLEGIGTANLTVTSVGAPVAGAAANAAGLAAAQGTGNNVDLKTTRKALDMGVEKWLSPSLLLEASFKNEDKVGARMWGRGFNCNGNAAPSGYGCVTVGVNTNTFGAILALPEPINSTIRQLELKLNYNNDKLALNGGYYGSFFTNKFGSQTLTFAGNLWQPNGAGFDPRNGTGNSLQTVMAPIALPPDNQSHQLSLAGTYAISPTTRATFKYAYTHGTQKENFNSMGLVGGPRGALDAVLDTTVAQVGITAKPLPKLSLKADLRYEQKSDKTPIDKYRAELTTASADNLAQERTNMQSSHTKIKGKLEASYQLPAGYRVTGGIDYDMRDLGRPTSTNATNGQATALRAKNDEITYRGELRKSMSETLNGAIIATQARRTGSKWMTATNGYAPTRDEGGIGAAGNGLFPLFWADANRDKLKGSVDWAVTSGLNIQASVEAGSETYFAPSNRGARDAASSGMNLDISYLISDKWKMNGWYSRNDIILDINGTSNAYMVSQRQLGHTLGLGVRGAPSGNLEVGADFTFEYEVNRTATGQWGGGGGASAIPAAAFRQLNLNMFGKYALDKSADIKVSLVHQRYYSNEWYWNNNGTSFFFSDGTTVTQKDQQNVTFLGAAYTYKF